MTDLLALTLSALIAEVMEERAADPDASQAPVKQSPTPRRAAAPHKARQNDSWRR